MKNPEVGSGAGRGLDVAVRRTVLECFEVRAVQCRKRPSMPVRSPVRNRRESSLAKYCAKGCESPVCLPPTSLSISTIAMKFGRPRSDRRVNEMVARRGRGAHGWCGPTSSGCSVMRTMRKCGGVPCRQRPKTSPMAAFTPPPRRVGLHTRNNSCAARADRSSVFPDHRSHAQPATRRSSARQDHRCDAET